MSGSSRSSAIYARLLALYPPEIRDGHRSEMLQNFDDLERASSSPLALWLVLGRDVLTSVGSYWIHSVLGSSERSFGRQVRIIATALALLLIIAWLRRPDKEPIIGVFCGGYLIGWISGWSRKGAVVGLALLGIALSVITSQRFPLAACYGGTLGWVVGRLGRDRLIRKLVRRVAATGRRR